MKNYINLIKNVLNPGKYNNYIYNQTDKYQKKFGFEKSSDPEHSFWNNEADAFKHTFLSADLALESGDYISEKIGNYHENQGTNSGIQPFGERNMDLWNNAIGREIGLEVKKELKGLENFYTKEQINDMIAVKIMDKMKNGELITSPDDGRLFEESRASGRVYTREDLQELVNGNKYDLYENDIIKQLKEYGGTMPTKSEADNQVLQGQLIYVEEYTKSDGTKIKGHYRRKNRS